MFTTQACQHECNCMCCAAFRVMVAVCRSESRPPVGRLDFARQHNKLPSPPLSLTPVSRCPRGAVRHGQGARVVGGTARPVMPAVVRERSSARTAAMGTAGMSRVTVAVPTAVAGVVQVGNQLVGMVVDTKWAGVAEVRRAATREQVKRKPGRPGRL